MRNITSWVAASVVMIVILPFVKPMHYLLIAYIAVVAAVPIFYSYVIFTRVEKRGH